MEDHIKKKIKQSNYYKYMGIAPEGFMLVPIAVIERLDSFDEWKEFKHNKIEWIIEKSKEALLDEPKPSKKIE